MRDLARMFLNSLAKNKVARSSQLQVASDAKVDFRGIRGRPPASLAIGSGSIFQGSIAAERPDARVSIGRRTFIGRSSLVCAAKIEIGDDVLISWGCTIIDHHSHSIMWEKRADDVTQYFNNTKNWEHVKIEPIKICDKAWIGFNSIVLSGVTIGEGAVIGCGSVVTRDVAPYTVAAGNPARLIREVQDEG